MIDAPLARLLSDYALSALGRRAAESTTARPNAVRPGSMWLPARRLVRRCGGAGHGARPRTALRAERAQAPTCGRIRPGNRPQSQAP